MHEFNEFLMKPDKKTRVFLISTDFKVPKSTRLGKYRRENADFCDYESPPERSLAQTTVRPGFLALFSGETRPE